MTSKDHRAIAAVFDRARSERTKAPAETMRRRLAYDIAKVMGEDNDRFDSAKFLQACGVLPRNRS